VDRLIKKLISFLLLLCISATIIPLNLSHLHEEETHCELTSTTHENDPCHISIYHTYGKEKHRCEHESHLVEEQNHCELCKIITSHRYTYIANKEDNVTTNLYSKSLTPLTTSFVTGSVSFVIFTRGPPPFI